MVPSDYGKSTSHHQETRVILTRSFYEYVTREEPPPLSPRDKLLLLQRAGSRPLSPPAPPPPVKTAFLYSCTLYDYVIYSESTRKREKEAHPRMTPHTTKHKTSEPICNPAPPPLQKEQKRASDGPGGEGEGDGGREGGKEGKGKGGGWFSSNCRPRPTPTPRAASLLMASFIETAGTYLSLPPRQKPFIRALPNSPQFRFRGLLFSSPTFSKGKPGFPSVISAFKGGLGEGASLCTNVPPHFESLPKKRTDTLLQHRYFSSP